MQKIGELAAETGDDDPKDLAHQIGLLIDGAIVAALITGDPKIARSARNAAVKILQSVEINDLSQNYPRI